MFLGSEMDVPDMPSPVPVLSEPRAVMAALVWLLSIMHPLVVLQMRCGMKRLCAQTTLEVPDIVVKASNMLIQAASARIAHVLGQAPAALKRLRNAMNCIHVHLPFGLLLEGGVATCLRTSDQIIRRLAACLFVRTPFGSRKEGLLALAAPMIDCLVVDQQVRSIFVGFVTLLAIKTRRRLRAVALIGVVSHERRIIG